MKNSPNTSAVFNLATTPAGSLSLALCVALASQGAWSATCPTRPACNVSQNNFSGNLAAGQSLCITGSFTGNINNLAAGATIYVPAGATFNPASLQNPAGSIINCGTATLPSITLNTGFNFSNHGTADFRSNINWNGKGTFFNDAGARMNLRTTFQMKGNSTITNDGEILSSGDFSSEPGTSITNTGYIRLTGGNFNPDGTVVNSGFVQTDEFININPNSELINNCSFISQKGFNNNSPKTRNNGYIFVTGVGNNNDLVQNNKPFTQGPNAVVVGTRFFNNGAITGGGKYYFTGDTRNQAAFGNDAGGINFYDTTRTSGKIFDVQAPDPHPSVTRNAFTPPSVDAVVVSCSRNVAPVKPVITINIIAGDDIINSLEDDAPVAVAGTTTDAPNGSLIQLELNGKTYSTTVSNNSWSLLVPALDAQLLDASEIVSAQVVLADNSASSEKVTRTVAHTTELPRITINTVAGDDIINSTEDDAVVVISGSTVGAENGATVRAQINGKNYTATVNNNNWSFNLPAADAQALKADELISATVTNAVGNISQPANRAIKHSTQLPSVTINVVAGDDIINAQEDDADVIISGTSSLAENGSSIALSLNGKNYSATVNNNTWSVRLPAADAQQLRPSETITARVTNLAGDTSQPATRAIAHDFVFPSLSINTIAGDDIINLTEDNSSVTISGTTSLVENGQSVSLLVNGKTYSAQVNNNIWFTSMPAADAQALKADEVVNGMVSNRAGNSAVAARAVKHSIWEPSVDIDVIAGDDIINTEEDNSPVIITGSTALVENGQQVKVTVNGKTYTATVTNDRWQLSMPAADAQALRANERVTATATNLAGDASEPASRDIQHSTASPSLSINTVAGDDIINSTEDDLPVIISGTSSLVENGRTVELTINGKNYTAPVNNNSWSVAISAADAQALDASETIATSVSNNAGDKASANRVISHSTQTPSIIINTIAGDDIINASEDDAPVIISGTTSLVENGAIVTLNLNGKTYTASVNNNVWSTSIPALDAQALGAVDKVIASVSNNAGDKATAERGTSHSGNAPTITINSVAGDDIINTTEDDADVVISGKTTLIEDGQKVTLIINGKSYEALVANNNWSTVMPAADAQALKASEKISASASNKAGDKATGERAISHSLNAPTISISPIAGDDIINTSEDDAAVLISGKTTLVEDGASVTLSVNGKNYSALVSDNNWSVLMPALDAQALSSSEKVRAEVSNKAGDKASAERALSHSLNAPTLSINSIAGDDIINASEDDAPVLINGSTRWVEDGAQLNLSLNGKNYTALVNNNSWSITVPALDAQALDPSELVAAKVINKAGDEASAQRAISHSGTAPSLVINIIAGDDIINTTEDDAPVVISGTTSLVEDGQAVQLSINGKNYLAVVNNNLWSTSITPIDAQALKASEMVKAQVNNIAGDTADASRTISHSLNAPTISINPIAGDDIINASEDDAPVLISGKTTLVEDGATLTLSLNGNTYTALVSNNSWSLSIPAVDAQALDAAELVSAQVINKAGDKASAERNLSHSGTAPSISINTVAGDDIINTTEDDAPVAISGTTTLVEDGQAVELSLNGKKYLAVVSNNSWTTSIDAVDAQALNASETISANISNKAGDKAEATRAISHSLNAPTISINPIAGDDIINASEDDAAVFITGKTTQVEDGAKLIITLNGNNYETQVVNNNWSLSIPAVDAQALKPTELVNAQVINKAGDKATAERSISHAGTPPSISINTVAGDDIINSTEDDASVEISGTTTLVENGRAVELTLNGKNYLAIVNNNIWSTSITATDAQALNSNELITAKISNQAGDKAEASRAISHSLNAPTISINPIAGDDIINASEDDTPVLISGKTSLVEDGAKLSLLINGKTYAAVVSNNSWAVSLPALDAQALDADELVQASVINKAGDKATTERALKHSGTAPSISINTIAGDDIINASEDDAAVLISGTTSLVENGAAVTIAVNGKNYSAQVSDNKWSILMPAADAQALGASSTVTAKVTNNAGDSASAERPIAHSGTAPTVSINTVAGDDIINSREDDAPVVISGATTLIEDGQSVTLLINGKTYQAPVNNNAWSTSIPALDAQALPANAKIIADTFNKAGDKANGERAISHSLNAPTLSINAIAGDDIINAQEDDAAVLISGSTTLVEDGAKVSISINGKTYTAIVSNNSWSVAMPALDAQALAATEQVNARVTNNAGDEATATRSLSHAGTAPTIRINTVAGDDIINLTEDDAPVVISGTTTLVENGQAVQLSINGKNYLAIVNDNIWSTEITPIDAQAFNAQEQIKALVNNLAGDKADTTRAISHSINAPTLSINVIAGDDIINSSEDDAEVLISGSTTLVEDGATLSLNLNGKTYNATISDNRWSLSVPAMDASLLDASELVSASVMNKAGDKATSNRTISHAGTAPSLSINTIAGDDIINTTEDDAPVLISGSTTLVEDGAKVVVSINGKNYEALVSNNSWSLLLPAQDAQALDATESINASVVNKAGEKATAERSLSHSTTIPEVSINIIASDDIINTHEDDDLVAVSGTTAHVENGQKVSLSINGKTYLAVVNNNTWATALSAADAQALPATTKAIARVQNNAGDAAKPFERSVQHSLVAPSVSINTVAGDDNINATEDDSPVFISGATSQVEDGQKITLQINGNEYTAVVSNDSWSINLPASDAQALNASEIIHATVANKAGDIAEGQRAVSHSTNLPTISIDVIAGDDVVNQSEDDAPVLISGTTTLAEDGSVVSLNLNNLIYSAEVKESRWSLLIAAEDAKQLLATNTVTAEVTNFKGDTSKPATRQLAHSQAIPTISINTVAGDDIINLTEDDAPVLLTGATQLAENGSEIIITVNGNNYKTTAQNDSWSLLIPAADAQALDATEIVTAQVTNKAGDSSTITTRSIFHSQEKPSVTINVIAGDDIINASEDDAPVVISGSTQLVEDGARVNLTINGKTYSPVVNNNSWTIDIPAADVQAFNANETVRALVTNAAGDESLPASRTVLHSPDKPAISIDVIAGDDIINTTEDDAAVIISGKTTLVENGQQVSLVVNGSTYTATVNNNSWSLSLPAAAAQALPASLEARATVANQAGDSADARRPISHSQSGPSISINPIAGDDIINTREDDAPVLITGTTSLVEDGASVELRINGKTYSAPVSNNTWSLALPAADAQALPAAEAVNAQVVNNAGDKASAERPISHSLSAPTISINPIAGDDIINASEDDAPVTVSGATTGVEDGALISLLINGKTYTAVVNNNSWSVLVPVVDVQALDPSEAVVAKVSNQAGDEAEVTRALSHSGTAPTISIAPITGDDIINSSEDDAAVIINGTSSGIEDGQVISLLLNGQTYSATVSNNSWATSLPAQAAQALNAVETLEASGRNLAGDEARSQRSISHSLTAPGISFNPVAGDDIINSLEDDAPVWISGKTSLVEDGALVSLQLNGKTYSAVVKDSAWFVELPLADVQALDALERIDASVTNKAGDKAEADKTIQHSTALPTISIEPVAGDDIINLSEDDAPVSISGSTTGVEDGQVLTLVVNGKDYPASVSNNRWAVSLPALDAQALDAAETLTAVVLNKAGDKADASRAISHSTGAPSISINPIAGDDIINSQEDDAPVAITGTTTGVEDGATISIHINGKTYDALVTNGSWTVIVPVGDVQALKPSETVTATVTNKAGDTADVTRTLIHSANAPTVSIATIALDDIINTSEDDAPVLISGTTTGVEDGQSVSLSLNGKTYPALVNANSWSLSLPAADAQALPASNEASAKVANKAGDSAEALRPLRHVTQAPTVAIEPVAGDDIINASEDDAPVLVSGVTQGVENGTTLVLTVNGKNYSTQVQGNRWSVELPATDAQALAESTTLVAKVTTNAGDSAEATRPINHYATGASISLLPITGDNLVNSLEDNGPVTVRGTTTGVENGAKVTFELNDADYEAIVTNGQWSLELPQAAVDALKPDNTAHAEVTNAQGDRADTTEVVKHVAWEDTDGDGLSDDVEGNKDSDKDGVPDYKDLDSDNDGLPDEDEIRNTDTDKNTNGIPDSFDSAITKGPDADNDGIDDRFDANVLGQPKGVDKNEDGIRDDAPVRDTDGDGLPDYIDLDSDNDAVPDLYEAGGSHFDTNGDGRADGKDSDGDGQLDVFDPSQGNTPLVPKDADKDGVPDVLDLDADNDGLPDIAEDAIGIADPDGDGMIGTAPFKDSDGDGLGDAADVDSGGKLGLRLDSDFNGSSDGQSVDRDGDGITDLEESVGKTQAQALDPDGDGRIGSGTTATKPNGTPGTGNLNVPVIAVKDSNGNGISDGIEEQLTNLHIPVPATNAQQADFDRDGYPDWIEVRYGGNPLDNAEADSNGNGIPDWVENTDILLDNQNDTDADGFADLIEQVQGTPADKRNSSNELFDAAVKNLLNPNRYEGRSLKPVIWVDMQQGRAPVAAFSNQSGEGILNGDAQLSVKIGNYHVFGDPRDPATTPVYDWSASSPEVLALAAASNGASLSFDPTRLAPGQYQVTVSVTLAEHRSTTVQRFQVGAAAVLDSDRDHLADSQDLQNANQGLLQAVPAQGSQLLQAAAITLVNNSEQLDHAVKLRLGAAALNAGSGQARLSTDAFSQFGTAIGNAKYRTVSNETYTYAQVYDLEVTNLPSVGGIAEVVIPLAQPIGANLHLQSFNPLSGWKDFVTTSGDELATAPAGADGSCPAPGSSLYEPGLNGGDSCLLVRVADGGANDADNNDTGAEDGQGDVNGLIQLSLTLAQDTPKQQAPTAPKGKIQTGLKGRGGALGWLFMLATPALLIFRRRKTHDQAR